MYRVYLALNMLVASFLPGGRPRETISGRVGRCWPGSRAARFIDALHPHEPDHCVMVAKLELAARKALGYRNS